MMLQLRFAPRFSAEIRAAQKSQAFRLGAPRAQPGMAIQLIESGSGRLLLSSWVLDVRPATISRRIGRDGYPQIARIELCGRVLDHGQHDDFAVAEGFAPAEPGCKTACEAMARFFATVYPIADHSGAGADLHGHVTVWAGMNNEGRGRGQFSQPKGVVA